MELEVSLELGTGVIKSGWRLGVPPLGGFAVAIDKSKGLPEPPKDGTPSRHPLLITPTWNLELILAFPPALFLLKMQGVLGLLRLKRAAVRHYAEPALSLLQREASRSL